VRTTANQRSVKKRNGRKRDMRLKSLPVIVAGASVGVLAVVAVAAPASASTRAPYIREGSRGLGVRCVQTALNDNSGAHLTVDGIDGAKTTAAVKAFQRAVGYTADGIVGPLTGGYLYSQDVDSGIGAACYPVVPTDF
jgi:peptidoglycan hydrolase-like protein with peptidoglycan-binding domain